MPIYILLGHHLSRSMTTHRQDPPKNLGGVDTGVSPSKGTQSVHHQQPKTLHVMDSSPGGGQAFPEHTRIPRLMLASQLLLASEAY